MTLWFGESWGAPICSETERTVTPVGAACLYCDERIAEQDQGVVMPFMPADGEPKLRAAHLDCFLQTVLPHGPECDRCRGLERGEHKMSCSYAKHGGECDCPFGKAALAMTNGDLTLGQAATLLGMTDERMLATVESWSHRVRALKQCRRTQRTHNPPDDSGKRKA